MLRRIGVFALAMLVGGGLAQAQPKPSSEVLLPYFEVDLDGGAATTVFAVLNSLDRTVDVTATVHSNWGLPVLSFPVKMKPREIWSANLADWLVKGKLPGRTLTAAELARLQDVLSGQPSRADGLYYSTEIAPELATGYVVLRTQSDALRGEHYLVNPDQGPAQGDDLVDVDKTNKPTEVCTLHTVRPLAGGTAGARLVVWMDRAGQALPAPVPADRSVLVTAAVYSDFGKLLKTLQLGLLPAEQVPLDDLGIGGFGRLEITTGDLSYVTVLSGQGAFSSTCSQAPPPVKKPAVRIVTLTNGQDANSPPGPKIAVGDTVTWQYQVTNIGTGALSKVAVKDDRGARVQCPKSALEPGQSMICSAKGTAEACQQKTIGTVTAVSAGKGKKKTTVSAQDTSHWYGDQGAAVRLVASVNGMDANDPATGPKVPAGSRLDWLYEVANLGPVRLLGITVTDDSGVAVSCPKLSLGPGEIMTCTAVGTALPGDFRHVGMVRASTACDIVSDDDPTHYVGDDSIGLQLQALVNGYDANDPPGPTLPVDGAVTWEYVVKNIGQYAVSGLAVGDDRSTAVSCPKTVLNPGESITCIGRGKAAACQSKSFASATGQSADGQRVSASDPAHWFGESQAAIQIESAVNGNDADQPPGPTVPINTSAQWTYTVTNLGKVMLTNVKVADDKGVTVTCPKTDLQPGQAMTCTGGSTAISGDYRSVATVTAQPPCGSNVTDDDATHYRGAGDPGIKIKTSVNGQDANLPPGPTLQVGDAVTWEYAVTNTGQFPLTNVGVADSRGAVVSCPQSSLSPGQGMTCTAKGTAQACQFDNQGTVTGRTSTGQQVSATDPSWYLGEHHAAIQIETLANGKEADAAPGPTIMVGSPVSWEYRITNSGDAPLSGIQVQDDQGAAVSCPKTGLQVGESMSCTASGTAVEGQYKNIGTVTARPACGDAVTAQDASHYQGGGNGALQIKTLVNGQDANEAPGPSIALGSSLTWTHTVKNVGLVSLSGISVMDDLGTTVTCPKISLQPGESMSCSGKGTAQACQNGNVGTATGKTATNQEVAATDPVYYTGQVQPGLTLELSVNGQVADVPPGPTITVNSQITWIYALANTGNVALSNVTASDSKGAAVDCPKTTLQPGEPMSCYAFGTAVEGAFSNLGTAAAVPACGDPIQALDPSHYVGDGTSSIEIKTLLNGQDVTTAPGPSLTAGSTIAWSFVVKNTGQLSLSNVGVSDSEGAASCPKTTLKAGESMTCTRSGKAQACAVTNVGSVTAKNAGGEEISASDASFYTGTFTASIQIETAVNGSDADMAPGPEIPYGSAVTWTYTVTNPSPARLVNVKVTDSQGAGVSCPQSSLDPGASMACQAGGTAVEGAFQNVGSVTADPPCGSPVSAQDPSNYFGKAVVAVELRKLTNNQDVAAPPGPSIAYGSTVIWSYVVKNAGNVALSQIAVKDDKVSSVSCPKSALSPGESMTCTATGAAQACQYQNRGSVTAVGTNGASTSADDLSWYLGGAPASLLVETSVEGDPADTPPGPVRRMGDPVHWKIQIQNTGQVDLTNITVTTSLPVSLDCGGKTSLKPGEVMACLAETTAVPGQHENVGTVTATPPCGNQLTVKDSAFYKGPPVLEFGTTTSFDWIWDDQGSGADRDGAFYRPKPAAGFFILGDYGQGNYSSPSGTVRTIRVKENDDPAYPGLVAPTGYNWIWDDKGSGADDDGSVWQPIAPAGYYCSGHVFVEGYNAPTLQNSPGLGKLRCVRADLMTEVQLGALIWNDRDSGADDDVSVFRVSELNVLFATNDYDNPPQEKTWVPLALVP